MKLLPRRPSRVLAAAAVALAAASFPATTAPEAAAAPARSARPNPKVGIASATYLDRNPQKLVSLGASWAYDWSARLHPVNLGISWVPMIWSARYLTPETITELQIAKSDFGVRYLLGFNEPDNRRQADMTPAEAAAFWPELEQTGLRLGSPAPDNPNDGWLQRFMQLAHHQHLRVNFIALHYYVDFTNPVAVAAMRHQLIAIHDRYHLPIWITELGALDITRWGRSMLHRPGVTQAQEFMRRVFPMLNALPFVKRYAWYTDNCQRQAVCRYSSLLTPHGAVTPEGREFRRDA